MPIAVVLFTNIYKKYINFWEQFFGIVKDIFLYLLTVECLADISDV